MNHSWNITVALPMTKERREILEAASPASTFTYVEPGKATEEDVKDADILIGLISSAICHAAKNCVWYQANAAGPDAYVKPGVFPKENVIVTSAVGAYGPAVGEHMLALTLAAQKNLGLYRDNQNNAIWRDEGRVGTLYNANVLVLGLGDIGGTYAKYCAAFGARVVGFRRHKSAILPEGVRMVCTMDELDLYLKDADVVAMCLPGSKETYHVIDERRLSLMKPTAVLVNCGRGNAVDCMALAAALRERRIFAAGLDVTEPEPLPVGHPLWSEKHCILTPHSAGWFHMDETVDRIVRIAAENLRHFERGETMKNVMTGARG